MLKTWKVPTGFVLGLTLVAFALMSGSKTVEARPNYFSEFKKTYKDLAKKPAAKKAKCNICHFGKGKGAKKNRNDYGKALLKHLGKKAKKVKMMTCTHSMEAHRVARPSFGTPKGHSFFEFFMVHNLSIATDLATRNKNIKGTPFYL